MPYTIDTAKTIQNLEKAGLENKQAEAIVDAIATASDEEVTKEYLDVRLDALKSHLSLRLYLMVGLIVGGMKLFQYLGV